ncbi:MAG: hypothetical protein LBH96_03825 [Candidatus Peribacteria bacterium]|jgi:hypothetical protein|nr:hypothetical protein [Candidatus Peribacteria bacterium]
METIKVLGVYGKDYPESCQTILPKNLAMFGIDMEVKENIEETGIEEIKEKYSAVIM